MAEAGRIMKDCARCKGTGWLDWEQRDDGHWSWPNDAIMSGRWEIGDWHPNGLEVGFCPVCPCTINMDTRVDQEAFQGSFLLLVTLETRELLPEESENLSEKSSFSVSQLRIRSEWLAHHLSLPLPEAEFFDLGEFGGEWWLWERRGS